MVKRCMYCNIEIDSESVVDMCNVCMYKVWGKKMSEAIVSEMEKEKIKGNLELGRVWELQKQETNVEESMEVSDELLGETGGILGDDFGLNK